MQKNYYGFGVDEKVKKIDNEHSDEKIEFKDEDDREIDCGQEDEDYNIKPELGEPNRLHKVSCFKKEKFLCLVVLKIQMIIQTYKQVQKSNNCLSLQLVTTIQSSLNGFECKIKNIYTRLCT